MLPSTGRVLLLYLCVVVESACYSLLQLATAYYSLLQLATTCPSVNRRHLSPVSVSLCDSTDCLCSLSSKVHHQPSRHAVGILLHYFTVNMTLVTILPWLGCVFVPSGCSCLSLSVSSLPVIGRLHSMADRSGKIRPHHCLSSPHHRCLAIDQD